MNKIKLQFICLAFLKILDHNREHSIILEFKGEKVYLCARCTGIMIGVMISALLKSYIKNSISLNIGVIISLLAILGWFIQHVGYMGKNNKLRLIMGGLLGVGLYLFISVPTPTFIRLGVPFIILLLIYIVRLVISNDCLKNTRCKLG